MPSITGRLQGVAARHGSAAGEFLLKHPKFASISDRVILIDPVDTDRHNFTQFAFFAGWETVERRGKAIEARGKLKCYTSDFDVSFPFWESFAVRKGSKWLLEWLNRLVLRMHETGIIVTTEKRWSANWHSIEVARNAAISIKQLEQPLRLILWLAIGCSVSFIVEWVTGRFLMKVGDK